MVRNRFGGSVCVLAFYFATFCAPLSLFAQNAPALSINLTPIVEKLTAPLDLAFPPDGTDRIFILEQTGQIWVRENGKTVPTPFLNIRKKIDGINPFYSEKGLLGFAFHPKFKENRTFFVYYSAETQAPNQNHHSVIASYRVSEKNPNVADETSERILLTIEQPEANHNGGCIVFGPDGKLYIGSGDGGGAGDKHGKIGNGQDLSTLLGKILRIDVNNPEEYKVPPDNPFINKAGARPEIYAYGLRNPWKISFDRKNGRLFCGDVGQNEFEEIDIIEKGKNYGWRIMEGLHCFNPPEGCNKTGLTPPIHEYPHDVGKCVIGGFVYRGTAAPSLTGKYIFADWTGKLFYLAETNGVWRRGALQVKTPANFSPDINAFGEDANGEIYVLTQQNTGPAGKSGIIYKITP